MKDAESPVIFALRCGNVEYVDISGACVRVPINLQRPKCISARDEYSRGIFAITNDGKLAFFEQDRIKMNLGTPRIIDLIPENMEAVDIVQNHNEIFVFAKLGSSICV